MAEARKTKSVEGGIWNAHRFRTGTVALREARKLQEGTELLIRIKSYLRSVREIAQDMGGGSSFKPKGIEALQVACEDCIPEQSEDTKLCAIHGNRVTVAPKGIKLA